MSTPISPKDFLSRTSSSRGIQRFRTAQWNYVATVRKATAVTHSCVGKGSLVEIYLITENELKPASANYLFIATDLYKFCVHRWDVVSSKLITIYTMRYPLCPHLAERQWNYCQGGTICRRPSNYYTVALYSSQVRITIIRTLDFQEFELVPGSVVNTIILDMKFLYGHRPPTVVVLGKKLVGGRFRFGVKVLEYSDNDFHVRAWEHLPGYIVESTLLIPVQKDPYGFLIMAREAFSYVQETGLKTKHMGSFNIKAYGRFGTDTKKHSYLLGDHDGRLLLIE
ncbi:unnamed protein product [Arabis nemorensis]|uniref:RSE1/DDB1/CPSF1 first beta-propeller domain-containing protein n=1 Tax=Arabis nemorensis TaxID=586526 RepID=A0A565C239_9BRAS|nr:unnamed protein product [Arabis nemorensis]